MSNNLGSQVYSLDMQNLVTVWEIDFTPILEDITGGIIRITSYKDGSNNNIVYAGNEYKFVGVYGSGFVSELNGQLPTPTVEFDKQSLNKLPEYIAIKQQYTAATGEVFFDWRGATIKRTRTTSNYLDGSYGDTNNYTVDSLSATTSTTIEARLTVSIGADRLNNQSVQELAPNRCALRYRTWEDGNFIYMDENAGGCPYGNPTTDSDWGNVPEFGDKYYTGDDLELDSGNKQFDSCSYSVKGCQLRFDPDKNGLVLPFVGKYKPIGN